MSRSKDSREACIELSEALSGEPVEAIVFGEWTHYNTPPPLSPPIGKRLTWAEAEPFLHGWAIDGGYGCEEVFPFYAWTATRVFYVQEYDGSTTLAWHPRNPIDCIPGCG